MAGSYEMERWIRKIAGGDRDALAQLYHATYSAVYAYALSITANRFDAEDVVHDCFLSVFRSAGSYRPQDKPMAWIMTITRNLSLKLIQQRQRYTALDSDAYYCGPAADPDDRLLIVSCMKLLSEQDRQIVILHAVSGCTHREIGRMLGLKTGTVLSRYHRAIQKLRTVL